MSAAGASHQHHHRGVGNGTVPGVNRCTVGGRQFGGIEDVLDADRQSGERTLRKSGRLGCAPRALDVECCERADFGLARRDRLRATIDDLARREFAGRDPAGQVEGGQHQAFPSIRATIRSVRRRAAGMMTKAVPAATGQAMK